jgi:hypothetical protein
VREGAADAFAAKPTKAIENAKPILTRYTGHFLVTVSCSTPAVVAAAAWLSKKLLWSPHV